MKKKRETVKPGLRTGRNGNQSGAPPGAAEWPNRFPRFHFQVVRPSKAPPQQNEISKETMNAPPALPQHFAATCSFISLSIYLSIYLSISLFVSFGSFPFLSFDRFLGVQRLAADPLWVPSSSTVLRISILRHFPVH